MNKHNNQIRGAIYGLLVGDAMGVPYEFNAPEKIPSYDLIAMTPPAGFQRTYADIAVGTWSDDGAQALCLLASLLECRGFDAVDFAQRLQDWYQSGYMAVDAHIFDVGIQTLHALYRFKNGADVQDMANQDEKSNGNGSLMRSLPLALWHQGSDQELVALAFAQSHVTHAHLRSKVCCAFYCLWARYLMQDFDVNAAWNQAYTILHVLFQNPNPNKEQEQHFDQALQQQALQELLLHVCPAESLAVTGSGYVVDCLHSAKYALQQGSYIDVVKTAIALGNDTDTTACVAGGLAGIIYGEQGIPQADRDTLRGKADVEPLIEALLEQLK